MIEIAVAVVIALVAGTSYMAEHHKEKETDTIICIGICQHSTTGTKPPGAENSVVYPDGDAPAPATEI